MEDDATLSSHDVCKLADVTYRQVDSWCRLRVIRAAVDARGSGTARRWTVDQAGLLRAFGQLSAVGATAKVLRGLAVATTADPSLWSGTVLVLSDGRVKTWPAVMPAASAWVLDLSACRAQVEQRVQLAS